MPTRSTSSGEQIQQAANGIKRGAKELGQQAQERMSELGDAARQQAEELQNTLESRIREKPINAILIAAGVGILVGMLWRR